MIQRCLFGGNAEVRQQDEDHQQRTQADNGAGSQHLHAAACVGGGGGAQLVQNGDDIDDNAGEVEWIDDVVEPVNGAIAPVAQLGRGVVLNRKAWPT